MKISAQCITYNRPELLEEAIESFHRQDWRGEKELIILNDGDQTLVYDHPDVKIINSPVRFNSIGEKRNACVALCSGDVIMPWDDDDICLPWRMSLSMQNMIGRRYFKNKRAWCWQNGVIKPEPKSNVYHAMGCWAMSLFKEIGGYTFNQSGQDMDFEDRVKPTGERILTELTDAQEFYIYKFGGTNHPHLSAKGYGKGFDEKCESGIRELKPHWDTDYVAMIQDVLDSNAAKAEVAAEAQVTTEAEVTTEEEVAE